MKTLEIINSDISRQYNTFFNNKKYFITFMDEYSSKILVYALK